LNTNDFAFLIGKDSSKNIRLTVKEILELYYKDYDACVDDKIFISI
jgi:hypothetical protein